MLNKIVAHMAEHGHAKRAIELFQTLAYASPQSRSIMMVNIGNAQLQLGDSPQNALAHNRLGDLESDNGRNDKAAERFARACELDPENSAYHASAETAYLQQKMYDKAISYLGRAVDLFPEQPLIFYNLAVALFAVGKEEAAVKELAEAVRIDKGYARG